MVSLIERKLKWKGRNWKGTNKKKSCIVMAIEEGWDGNAGSGRSSWVSGRRDGRQVALESDDDFEVESSMLAPLAERRDSEKTERGWRVRAATKRRRALHLALAGFLISMVGYASVGGFTSTRWALADSACQRLRFESTEGNSVSEWAKWASAVSQVYLRHKVLAMPASSENQRDSDQLHQIEHDRRVLEGDYSRSVASAGLLPSNQQMRFPAGLGLEYSKAESMAELGVCEMEPKDRACIAARKEEVEAVKVLHAELHKRVSAVISEAGGLVGDIQQPVARMAPHVSVLRKLAELIHRQKSPDLLSQQSWRELNAVSAVVLKQTLERVAADGDVEYHDIMLHHNSPHILYIGAFRGLKFHGLGCLYHKDGSLAYSGAWRDGLVDGEGSLLDHRGVAMWKGSFVHGDPERPWYSL